MMSMKQLDSECDTVFLLLTAGSAKHSDHNSTTIARHLEHCASCRSIAEALRPALHLVHEALPHADQIDLPVYGDHDPEATIMGRIESLEPASNASHVSTADRNRRYVVAMAVAAALLWLLLWNRSPADNGISVAAHQGAVVDLADFAGELPAVCLTIDARANQHLAVNARQCCTTCHHADEDAPKVRTIARLTATCHACHQ